jgi:orotidine-5'-phosphate decarboxylase
MSSPIFVAIDQPDVAAVQALAQRLAPHVGGIKLGLEFFCAAGPDGIRSVRPPGLPLFLDLKLHDIPNTVAGAVRAATALAPSFITVHAAGGTAMLRAAVAAAADAAAALGVPRPRILGVTVLTSLDAADLSATGQDADPAVQVERLARLAESSGLDGIVCSPWEIARLRGALRRETLLVVPGIRPAGSAAGDQKRVMTPAAAMSAGADHLVIGRPITDAADPVAAASAIAASLA